MYNIKCVACGDTGLNSRGYICPICYKNNRQTLRDVVVGTVQELFAEKWIRQQLPTEKEIIDVVRWACEPPVVYAACYGSNDELGFFAGPVPHYAPLLDITPEDDPYGRTAYIVKLARGAYGGEPHAEPFARWHGGRWQRKKGAMKCQ